MSRVLVTGASGFVGRHLTTTLHKRGYHVIACVRNREFAQGLSREAEVRVVDDIERADWPRLVTGVDSVVHLAAHVHRVGRNGERDPQAYYRVNVLGTQRLAIAAARASVGRVVFLSSVKAVGDGYADPKKAYIESDPCLPQHAYGKSKREAEVVLRDLTGNGALKVTVLRPPLVYGPGVKANFLRLLRTVDRGLPLPLATVHNRRSLLFVGNLVDAVERVLRNDKRNSSFETFFVADTETVSTPELIRRLAQHLNRPSRLVPFPVALLKLAAQALGKPAVVDRLAGSLVVDTSRIRSAIGWEPPFSLDEGLATTVEWYRRLNLSR